MDIIVRINNSEQAYWLAKTTIHPLLVVVRKLNRTRTSPPGRQTRTHFNDRFLCEKINAVAASLS
jgi:hypothetical protein